MRSLTKHMAVMALVGSFVLTWRAHTDQDVVVAQAHTPIMMTRIYTGPDGLSHAEEIGMNTNDGVTAMMKATGVQFSTRPPSPFNDWHPGPQAQYVITLSGHAEIELADGHKVAIGPGHIDLIEDTTGKGHRMRNLGPDNRVVVTIPLAGPTVATDGR
jgi:hypothetical protein